MSERIGGIFDEQDSLPQLEIMQGDEYNIPISITAEDGTVITDSNVNLLEVTLGELRKVYPGEVSYSGGKFCIPISQAESFAMPPGMTELQARCKFIDGSVVGDEGLIIEIKESKSKVVL